MKLPRFKSLLSHGYVVGALCLGFGAAIVVAGLAVTRANGQSSTFTTSAYSIPNIPGLKQYTLTSGGHTRSYVEYSPPGVTRALPVVLMYHSANSTAQVVMNQTSLLNIARTKHNVILAFMQGYDDSWNEGSGHTPATRAGINDVAYTKAVLAAIEKRHAVARGRIAAAGISNGAIMDEYLGCQLAANLTFIMPVEGQLPTSVSPKCHPSRPISVYEVHGTADPTIPYNGGLFYGFGGSETVLSAPASIKRWATLDGCKAGSPAHQTSGASVFTKYRDCKRGVLVTLDSISGGVHAFPSNFGQTIINLLNAHPAKVAAARA